MAKFDSAQHFIFRQFVSFGFHHHDGVFGASHNQIQALLGVQAQLCHVVHRGVQDISALGKAHAAGSDRAHERHAGNRQRGRGRNHRHHVGIVDKVARQHGRHDQHFMLETFDKQRAAGAVDQAGNQRFLF